LTRLDYIEIVDGLPVLLLLNLIKKLKREDLLNIQKLIGVSIEGKRI
jgi:hypothetical protein